MASRVSLLAFVALALGVLSLTACSGGSGCGGALPDGYPREERIQNAGSIRLTRSGLDFLAANAGTLAGGLIAADGGSGTTFEIPKSESVGSADAGSVIQGLPPTIVDYTIKICPAGPKPTANPPECSVEVDLPNAKFQVDTVTPNVLRINGNVPVRLRNLPIHIDTSLGTFVTVEGGVGLGTVGNPQCTGNPATKPVVDYKTYPIAIEFPLVAETLEPRDGYTKIDVDAAKINLAVAPEDIAICATCGLLLDQLGVCNQLVTEAKANATQVFGGDTLGEMLKGQLKTAVCLKADPTRTPSCPKGTLDQNGSCVFATNTGVCATSLLGTEGRLDTGSVVGAAPAGAAGPNAEGAIEFLFAGSGPMNAAPNSAADDAGYPGHTPNGLSLAMFGGTRPVAVSRCVPPFTPTKPEGIPFPDELLANAVTPWPAGTKGPDLGLSFSGRFIDYAFGSIYGSGALCIGATTEDVDQLRTGLLSLIMPSIKNLTFEQKGAAMAIATRPQTPPRVALGTGADLANDPLLRIQLDRFAIDFYVFMLDRFVRIMTFTADLSLPVNLQTGKDPQKNPNGGLLPVLGEIVAKNAEVTGGSLLIEDPVRLASSLSTLVGGLTSQLTGSLGAVDLSSALASAGIALEIPEGGIRKLTKDNDAFLGIFANLQVGQAATVEADARARILERRIDKAHMTLGELSRATRPSLAVELGTSSAIEGRPVEWSWAIDRGTRSAWSRETHPVLVSDDLAMQGRHVLRVWARTVGLPRTEDTTPAEIPFVIDALAPDVSAAVDRTGTVTVEARDYISERSALRARVRRVVDGREESFGPWAPLASLTGIDGRGASAVDVEVVDEEENVGRLHLSLIRGRGDPSLPNTGATGCGCTTAGATPSEPIAWLGAAALALAFAIRRARAARARRGSRTWAPLCRHRRAALAALAVALAGTPACSCSDDDPAPAAKCGTDCKQACGPALPFGMIGAYTSVAKTKAGKILVAGYADATIEEAATGLYGDLVVGEWDEAKKSVAWQTVDGVPPRTDGTCPSNDRQGFRGGETEPGDDVGLWTSIAVGESAGAEVPMVAYHDATNRTLKFAYKGKQGWQSYVLFGKAGSDSGRYAKLVMFENRPAVVFLLVEPGSNGKQQSRIVLARGSEAVPGDASKWTLQDVHTDSETPCWPGRCAAGEACVKGTKACTKTIAGCAPNCTTGTACVPDAGSSSCVDVNVDPQVIAVPDATGVYLSAAVGPFGLGIVAYDRPRGNLLSFVPEAGGYKTYVLDGETGSRADGTAKDTGDVGLGATLAIGADGDWHIAYVDGTREALLHLTARLGMTAVSRDVIDDGLGIAGVDFRDGKHIVGDDATIRVDDGNIVTVCYQDATATELRCATGGPGTAFSVKVVAQPGRAAGFFPKLVPGAREVANHWRALDRGARTYSGDVAITAF